MFSILFSVFKVSVLVGIANDYFTRTYPQEYENFLFGVSYNLIYLFSKCQILANKTCSKIQVLINKNQYLKQISDIVYKKNIERNQIYKIDKTGEIVNNYSGEKIEYDNKCIYILADNEKKSDTGCVNMEILQKQPMLTNCEFPYLSLSQPIASNIKFMLLEVKLNDAFYKLDLKTDKYNYYVVGNVLDKQFFIYFLKNYHTYNFTNDEIEQITKLDVKIIDQNVNIKEMEITDTRFITIKKDEFTY